MAATSTTGIGQNDLTRRMLALLIAGLMISGIAGVLVDHLAPANAATDDRPLLEQAPPLPTTTAPPPTAPPTTAAPAPKPAAPKPKRPVTAPKNEYAPEPIVQIGTIEIPKIAMTSPIYHGITMRNIDLGPSHWPGTAMPGENGNAVFAGHRVTHSHPFRNIDQLVPGDQVFFTVNGVRTVYTVTGHDVVRPTQTEIVNQTTTPTATLFACHPPHSAAYRYVVHLALSTQ